MSSVCEGCDCHVETGQCRKNAMSFARAGARASRTGLYVGSNNGCFACLSSARSRVLLDIN